MESKIQDLILNDFFTGGFPINRKSPVMCITDDGGVTIAYNRHMLHSILNEKRIKSCFGIWPGKKYTGVFNLCVEEYADAPYPPKEHADIDSAESVMVHLENGEFDSIVYTPGPQESDHTPVVCKDVKLFDYIRTVSLRHQIVP